MNRAGPVVGTWRAFKSGPRKARELRRLTNEENAWLAVQGLKRSGGVLGLTKGQFSLIDLVRACLELAGSSVVTISTWTAANKEIDDAAILLKDGRIKAIRWLVDFSFPRRQPIYCAKLVDRFGEGCIRVTKNHAKFVTVVGGGWHLSIRTSMNLNKNPRFEYFEIEDSKELVEFLSWVVDEVFEEQAAGVGLKRRPSENEKEFEGLGVEMMELEGEGLGADLTNPGRPGFGVLA